MDLFTQDRIELEARELEDAGYAEANRKKEMARERSRAARRAKKEAREAEEFTRQASHLQEKKKEVKQRKDTEDEGPAKAAIRGAVDRYYDKLGHKLTGLERKRLTDKTSLAAHQDFLAKVQAELAVSGAFKMLCKGLEVCCQGLSYIPGCGGPNVDAGQVMRKAIVHAADPNAIAPDQELLDTLTELSIKYEYYLSAYPEMRLAGAMAQVCYVAYELNTLPPPFADGGAGAGGDLFNGERGDAARQAMADYEAARTSTGQ